MRAVVNVATGRYLKGQERLTSELVRMKEEYFIWNDKSGLPAGCPPHSEIPYAFKAYALREAFAAGFDTLLWADASVKTIAPLGALWERIEREGYWIQNNGWTNYEWTADSAYPDLFPLVPPYQDKQWDHLDGARLANRGIKHVVAGCFGLSMRHPIGKAIFDEYFRLASETKAFCGPWLNTAHHDPGLPNVLLEPPRGGVCGPEDVRGHRHDQTALSVIAWRLGCKLIDSPEILAYEGGATDKTILVMDGIC